MAQFCCGICGALCRRAYRHCVSILNNPPTMFDILQVCTPARLKGCIKHWDPWSLRTVISCCPCYDSPEAFWDMGGFEEIEKPRFVGERVDRSLLCAMMWIPVNFFPFSLNPYKPVPISVSETSFPSNLFGIERFTSPKPRPPIQNRGPTAAIFLKMQIFFHFYDIL